ncbi:MAG: IclR family transcriptional regulator [Thermoflexales bacterium]|nr:IclR family transcriptional regulator [Thermoflexales bacterium]
METAQTVLRALALLEAVAEGVHDLEGLSAHVGLSRSTAHRLLTTLVRAGYLRHSPREGYRLGPKLIELGFRAHAGLHLPSLARPYLEELSEATRETVHLGVLDGNQVVYIDKVPGKRELQMASYIGARVPAQSTALGKALVSTLPREEWLRAFVPGLRRTERTIAEADRFLEEIERVAREGYALDLEENEPGIRCVAAPVRDGAGRGVAAVSISSAVLYLTEERIRELIPLVRETARRISRELGWRGDEAG